MTVAVKSLLVFSATALAVASTSAPACGCIPTAAHSKEWVGCSLRAAAKVGENRFYRNYLVARRDEKKLLPTAPPRWERLERRIEAACGSFAEARQRDVASGTEDYIPDNFVDAVWN